VVGRISFSALLKTMEGNWEGAKENLEKAITFHESVGLVGWLNWFQLEKAKVLARERSVNDALTLVSTPATHPTLLLLRVPALQLQAELMAQSGSNKSRSKLYIEQPSTLRVAKKPNSMNCR
jgi:hypothetical protein